MFSLGSYNDGAEKIQSYDGRECDSNSYRPRKPVRNIHKKSGCLNRKCASAASIGEPRRESTTKHTIFISLVGRLTNMPSSQQIPVKGEQKSLGIRRKRLATVAQTPAR
jgi:hypothetical protein